MTYAYDQLTGRKQKDQARAAAKAAEENIARQKQLEAANLAEASSDLAAKKALGMSGKGGRRSLIATANTGLVQNLGGAKGQ
jgi:hypothetical protein